MSIFTFKRKKYLSVGIGLGLRNISAVAVNHNDKPVVVESDCVTSEIDYYSEPGMRVLKNHLEVILQSVSRWIGKKYVIIKVSIEDPIVYTHTLNIDSFPKSRALQDKLISWQIAKAFGLNVDNLIATFNYRKGINIEKAVFITAVDKILIDYIISAFNINNVIPECIMMSSLYRKPIDHIEKTSCMVQVILSEEYVAIEFWGESSAPLCIRSFWRRKTTDYDDIEVIDTLHEVERTVHSFSVSNKAFKIENVLIFSNNRSDLQYFKKHFCFKNISELKEVFFSANTEQVEQKYIQNPAFPSAVMAALS